MSKTIVLQTHKNYIDRALSTTPQNAIYELIWNACDADAEKIEIRFVRNDLDNIVSCKIKDDGVGIDSLNLANNFGYLGFSDKQSKYKTPKGRIFHGKLGQGRYNAVSVASEVIWNTTYEEDGKYFSYTIKISSEDRQHILVSEAVENKLARNTGTEVTLNFLENKGNAFSDLEVTMGQLVANFAPYLKSYPSINLVIEGNAINIDEYIEQTQIHDMMFVNNDGVIDNAKLVIIKWKDAKRRGQLFFCDAIGTVIENCAALNCKGLDAYLCSHYFSKIEITAILESFRMDSILNGLVDEAIEYIKKYVISLQDGEIIREIDSLKHKKIYPYNNAPQNEIEKAEQSQFEILAVEVNKIIPQLRKASDSMKRLTYSLLKETIKTAPDSFTEILNSIIALDDVQRDSLAKLLKTTSLPAIIKTSQLLINRSKFLDALYLMVYDDNVERAIKERTQFQKILLDNLWVFGEDYSLGADDISVRNLLKKYVTKLGRQELIPAIPDDGAYDLSRIPDICLFNKYPLGDNMYRNLVIEIKRPKKTLGKKEYDQIIDYHDIITKSAAFPGVTTKWHFILIGKDFDSFVQSRVNDYAASMGRGNVINGENSKVTILSWGELIQKNKAKIEYLTKSLELQVGEESDIIQFLHDNYGKYLSDKKE